MNPMNPGLYAALRRAFGHVGISNHGVKAECEPVRDFFDKSSVSVRPDHRKIRLRHWGEVYNVCCPYCGDTRDRLYFSHLWGTEDPRWMGKMLSPVCCKNEGCNMSDIWNYIYSGMNVLNKSEVVEVDDSVAPAPMVSPGQTVPICSLEPGHPAREYLEQRGFDIARLSSVYQVCYCVSSPWVKPAKAGRLADTPARRIIIPNLQKGGWHGWLARYVGQIPLTADGKQAIRKYLNAPGYQFSSTVYSVDLAEAASEGKLAIVNEGPLSAVACGDLGVALFGMSPKPLQEDILASRFRNGRLVFLVEAEARSSRRLLDSMARLDRRVAGGCTPIYMEPGQDAATMGHDKVMSLIGAHS